MSTQAARLSNLLREWDKGGRGVRNQILTDFVAQCRSMTGPQLEKALGNGASLLLARISSWLRLSYALGSSVAIQLRAISVFVAASSGQRFLAEFVEVGGVAAVVDILSLKELPAEDKHEAIRLLASVASAGRHYKEIICVAGGPERLRLFMEAVHPERALEEARDLLVTLGRGNPQHSITVHRALLQLLRCEQTMTQRLAAAGLRSLVAVLPTSQLGATDASGEPLPGLDAAYPAAALSLFHSFNLQVLYEATQLLAALVALPPLEEPLLRQLVALLRESAPPPPDGPGGDEGAPVAVPLHVRASAARCLGQLVSGLNVTKRSSYCASLQLVPWLCTLLLVERSPECQKASVQALQLLGWCAGSPLEEMRGYLSAELLTALLDATDVSQAVARLDAPTLATVRARLEPFLARDGGVAEDDDDDDTGAGAGAASAAAAAEGELGLEDELDLDGGDEGSTQPGLA